MWEIIADFAIVVSSLNNLHYFSVHLSFPSRTLQLTDWIRNENLSWGSHLDALIYRNQIYRFHMTHNFFLGYKGLNCFVAIHLKLSF